MPKIKNYEVVRKQVRAAEQSGREPEKVRYLDHKGIRTIATGFNLERSDSRKICQNLGIDFDAINPADWNRVPASLTVKQAQDLENYVICEAAKICVNKIDQAHFDKLTPEQQASLISVAFTPKIVGPQLISYIQSDHFELAADEIQYRSNGGKNKGIQNRRNQEAALFRLGMQPTHATDITPASAFTPPPMPTTMEMIGNFIQNHVTVSFRIQRPKLMLPEEIKCFLDFQQEFLNCKQAIENGKNPDIAIFEGLYKQCHAIIMAGGYGLHTFDPALFAGADEVTVYGARFFAAFYGKNTVTLQERLNRVDEYKHLLDESKKALVSLVVNSGHLPTKQGRKGSRCTCLPPRPGPVKRVHDYVRLELKNGCGEPLYSGELRECGGQSAAVQEVQGLFKTNITWPTTQIAVAELMRIQEQHNLAFFLSTSWLDAMCHLGESINVAAIAQEIPDKPTPSSAWHACCKHGTTFWLGRVCATKEDAEKELLDSEHHGHKEGRVTPIPAPD